MSKLVDIIGFSGKFPQHVRIRLADTLYYFTRKQYGVDEPTE